MKNILYALIVLMTTTLINGCGSNDFGSSGSGGGQAGFSLDDKRYLKKLFLGPYLWYDHVDASLDPAPYTTPQSLINAMKYDAHDHWSFAMTQNEFESFLDQKGGGFGVGFTPDLQVKFVRINAPAWGKLKRGDTIEKINGQTATPARLHAASKNLGSSSTFEVNRHGQILSVSLTPRSYTYHATLDNIVHTHGHTVGYLRYDTFSDASGAELAQRFAELDNANIDDLVIDLRYNGGGVVGRAVDLMGYITRAHPDDTAARLAWNDRYRDQDKIYPFASPPKAHSLNLNRIFFLVTQNSASASELAINGLRPYFGNANVITIGSNTHGKNVGMAGVKHNSWYYFLINFYVENANDDIMPQTGIPPTCPATDDWGHALGDPNETMLSTALYYIEHDQCPTTGSPKKVGRIKKTQAVMVDGEKTWEGLIE